MGSFAGVEERSGLKWSWLPGESVFVRTRTEVVAVHWVEGNKPRGFLAKRPFHQTPSHRHSIFLPRSSPRQCTDYRVVPPAPRPPIILLFSHFYSSAKQWPTECVCRAHNACTSPLNDLSQGRGGARGGPRGGPAMRGGRGPQPTMDKPKREAILDLSKYVNERIRVKFTGGREGALPFYSLVLPS